MSDVPGQYRQSRPAPSPFPPHPYFELRGRGEVYLILPHSKAPHDLERFQVFSHGGGWHQDYIGKLGLERLLSDLRNGYAVFGSGTIEISAIRRFYMDWNHVAPMEQPRALVDRLKQDIERGSLTVFRFQIDPHMGVIRQEPGQPVPQPNGAVSTWSARQKVGAMFRAIPDYLEGAAKAEFEAFLTPENLVIMAVFLGGIGALQAVPGADAAVDGMIAGLAWWQFGWAGVIAGKDFIEAVIKANRATTRDEIMLAAKLAAAALVSLGITVLLKKITENVHEVRWTKDEPQGDLPPKTKSESSTKSGPTETQLREQRFDTAKDYYQKTGWPEDQITRHLKGIDLSKDVSVETLKKGTEVTQWVDPSRGVGNYFAPDGTMPDQLGINSTGRILQKFVVTEDTQILQSTAAPIVDTWSSATPVATGGGGLQWFTADKSTFQLIGGP